MSIYEDSEGWFVKLNKISVYGPFKSKKAAKRWVRSK
jgi:hypothetical protein